MKILDQIKRREHRPALIIALLLLVYMWFFSVPRIWDVLQHSRSIVMSWSANSFASNASLLGGNMAELVCTLGGLLIWIASVFVTLAALLKSRKKAYILLLAYFLLPLVLDPVARIGRQYSVAPAATGNTGLAMCVLFQRLPRLTGRTS